MATLAPLPAPPVFELRDAAFGYQGVAAVTGVTAQLFPGEAVALIGPNGSGKSTVLGGLVGLTEHLAGNITVFAKSPQQARPQIGLLPQRDTRNLQLPVTVQQVVAMGLYRKLGMRPLNSAARAAITAAVAQVGLEAQLKKSFNSLSGGQQQRAILARALVSQPQLLLLDEPFNGLDRPNREALLATVKQLRDAGCAIAVSTHDLEIAREVCSHVMLLDKKMIAYGPLSTTLTVQNIAATFHDTTVDLGSGVVTTRHEAAEHLHHTHSSAATLAECDPHTRTDEKGAA